MPNASIIKTGGTALCAGLLGAFVAGAGAFALANATAGVSGVAAGGGFLLGAMGSTAGRMFDFFRGCWSVKKDYDVEGSAQGINWQQVDGNNNMEDYI